VAPQAEDVTFAFCAVAVEAPQAGDVAFAFWAVAVETQRADDVALALITITSDELSDAMVGTAVDVLSSDEALSMDDALVAAPQAIECAGINATTAATNNTAASRVIVGLFACFSMAFPPACCLVKQLMAFLLFCTSSITSLA